MLATEAAKENPGLKCTTLQHKPSIASDYSSANILLLLFLYRLFIERRETVRPQTLSDTPLLSAVTALYQPPNDMTSRLPVAISVGPLRPLQEHAPLERSGRRAWDRSLREHRIVIMALILIGEITVRKQFKFEQPVKSESLLSKVT